MASAESFLCAGGHPRLELDEHFPGLELARRRRQTNRRQRPLRRSGPEAAQHQESEESESRSRPSCLPMQPPHIASSHASPPAPDYNRQPFGCQLPLGRRRHGFCWRLGRRFRRRLSGRLGRRFRRRLGRRLRRRLGRGFRRWLGRGFRRWLGRWLGRRLGRRLGGWLVGLRWRQRWLRRFGRQGHTRGRIDWPRHPQDSAGIDRVARQAIVLLQGDHCSAGALGDVGQSITPLHDIVIPLGRLGAPPPWCLGSRRRTRGAHRGGRRLPCRWPCGRC